MKTDIASIDNSLDLLRGFNYYTFNYKTSAPIVEAGKEAVGVMAQEIQGKFDYAVLNDFKPYSTNEQTHLSINYIKFLPLLVNSLKTLSTKVKELSAKIE